MIGLNGPARRRKPGPNPVQRRIAVRAASARSVRRAQSPEVLSALNSTASLLELFGHAVEEQSPTYDRSLVGEIMGVASAYALTELISSRPQEIGVEPSEHNLELANVKSFARGRALAASDLMQTYRKINTVGRAFAGFFDRFDVWLTPASSHRETFSLVARCL